MNLNQYRLIAFDLNGTVASTPFIDKEPLHLLPGRKEALHQLVEQGKHVVITSNQAGPG